MVRINIIIDANSWLNRDTLDFYVKITCSTSGLQDGKTFAVHKNINPELYIPIYDTNNKFEIQVYSNAFFKCFKRIISGPYILDLKDLDNGVVKGKKLDLANPENRTLQIQPRPNKRKLHLVADFYSFPNEHTKSKTTITFYNLCSLKTYQCKDGSFKPTDELANLFNFNSKDELIRAFTATIKDNKIVEADHDVWGTVLITGNLIPFIVITYDY